MPLDPAPRDPARGRDAAPALSRLRLAGLGVVAVMSGAGAALSVTDDRAAPAAADEVDVVVEAPPRPVEVDATLVRSVARQILTDQQRPGDLTNLDLVARDVLADGPVAPADVHRATAKTLLGNGPGGPVDEALPAHPCPPTARACIDVDGKRAWLQDSGRVTYGPVPVTTGRPGYETARGTHRVLRHVRHDHSRLFDSPMPFSTYFTVGGMAFHEGRLDEPSHGCIHLGHHAAAHFFEQLRVGDEVFAY